MGSRNSRSVKHACTALTNVCASENIREILRISVDLIEKSTGGTGQDSCHDSEIVNHLLNIVDAKDLTIREVACGALDNMIYGIPPES